MKNVLRLAIVDPNDATRNTLKATLLSMDLIWLEAECSRYEFFADVVAQARPDIAIVCLDHGPDKAISLVVQSPHELDVYGDRDLLIEAIVNLVDNAIKFTPAGGRVEIGLIRSDDETIVRVRDSGCGISEHERDAVLRRFYRSDKTRHTSGLGLGLNLVAAIVKLHGFRFTVYPGTGCVVEIACPHATIPM